jgi:hypothetical protein
MHGVPFNYQRRNTNMSTSSRGTNGSKGVLAPNAEDQVGRVTRQKTKELSSAKKDLHGSTTKIESTH